MQMKMPDFRNLFTTGNLMSLLGAVAIGASAWTSVQAELSHQKASIEKLQRNDDTNTNTMQKVATDIAVMKNEQGNQTQNLTDIKEWMKAISNRLNK